MNNYRLRAIGLC
uniref:Uncharacterized protein n=1 Tax=Arundo donax TaxID=35708 RepID=A0A0A9BSB1_ARUDO